VLCDQHVPAIEDAYPDRHQGVDAQARVEREICPQDQGCTSVGKPKSKPEAGRQSFTER